MPSSPSRICRAVRPPRRGVAVKMAPLSAGSLPGARGDRVDDVGAGGDGSGDTGDGDPGVVVDDVEDFDVAVIGQAPVGDVGLPALVGQVGSKRFHDERGRFWGWGV